MNKKKFILLSSIIVLFILVYTLTTDITIDKSKYLNTKSQDNIIDENKETIINYQTSKKGDTLVLTKKTHQEISSNPSIVNKNHALQYASNTSSGKYKISLVDNSIEPERATDFFTISGSYDGDYFTLSVPKNSINNYKNLTLKIEDTESKYIINELPASFMNEFTEKTTSAKLILDSSGNYTLKQRKSILPSPQSISIKE